MIFTCHTCSICGHPISWDRLKIFPETCRCVRCAEEYGSDIDLIQTKIGMDIDTYKDLLGAVRS